MRMLPGCVLVFPNDKKYELLPACWFVVATRQRDVNHHEEVLVIPFGGTTRRPHWVMNQTMPTETVVGETA
jgi:hypothetical protein